MVDKFIHCFGEEVDLDELQTYFSIGHTHKLLSKTTREIADECAKELGYAHVWMRYYHGDLEHGNQEQRVDALGEEFGELKEKMRLEWLECHDTEREDPHCHRRMVAGRLPCHPVDFKKQDEHCSVSIRFKLRFLKLHFRILDEIENMC